MKNFVHIIVTSLIVFGAQTSSAALLTFEDVPGGSIQNKMGIMPTYKGFNFSKHPSRPLYWIDVEGSTWDFGAHNGDFALSNQESNTGIIIEASDTDFTFGGLWAKRYGADFTDTIKGFLSGYNDGELVWELTDTELSVDSYINFGPQAGLIDELRLGFGNYFLVDDIVLTAVPVPAAAWLFGSGLIGLIGVARRKPQA